MTFRKQIITVFLVALGCFFLLACAFWQWQKYTVSYALSFEPIVELSSLPDFLQTGLTQVQFNANVDQSRYFAVENKVQKGQNGYDLWALVTPAGTEQEGDKKRHLLVNFSWHRTLDDLIDHHQMLIAKKTISCAGILSQPSGFLLLQSNTLQQSHPTYPQVISQIDIASIEKQTQLSLYPYTLYDQNTLFAKQTLNEEYRLKKAMKHLNYALQFLFFALALLTYGIVLVGYKKRKP